MLELTYSGPCVESNVRALIAMFKFVKYLGLKVSKYLQFTYPHKLNDDMLEYCTTLIDKYITSSKDHK